MNAKTGQRPHFESILLIQTDSPPWFLILPCMSPQMDCVFEEPTNSTIVEVRVCSGDIGPRIEWYQYIIDFALGEGIFNDTILFYGRYGNTTVVGNTYSLPLAYLLMTAVVYAISIILLVYK